MLGGAEGVLELRVLRSAGGHAVAGGVGAKHLGAVDGVDHGADGGRLVLVVEERGDKRGFLTDIDRLRRRFGIGNTELDGRTDPDRRGHSQVAVFLRHLDIVVAVLRLELRGQFAGGELLGVIPSIGGLAAVHNELHLAEAVIGIIEVDRDFQLLRGVLLAEDRAHGLIVDRVEDLQVLVFGGIHAQRADRVVDALLGEVVGQDDVAGVVGVAPAALVVVLVVGGRHMPAFVQRHGVLLIAGVVAAGTDLALAVADLDQEHVRVRRFVPISEIGEVAEGRARVVELVQAVALVDGLVVELHAGVAALVVQLGVVAGHQTVAVEGVDVAGTAGPGHLKAREGEEIRMALIEGRSLALVLLPERTAALGHEALVVERVGGVRGAGGIKVVGVVGEGHELDVRALRKRGDVIQRGVQRAGAVGIGGVGVQLAEIQLVLGLAHGKVPALFRFNAVRALDRDHHSRAALRQILGRRIAQHTIFKHGLDGLAVDGHREHGILAHIADLRGNHGLQVVAGLRVGRRRQLRKEGLVDDLDRLLAAVLDAVAVFHIDPDDELACSVAVDVRGGKLECDDLAVGGLGKVCHGAALGTGRIGNGQGLDLIGQIVQREGAVVILFHKAGVLAVKDHAGILHDVVVDPGILGRLVEVEEVDAELILRAEGPAGEDAGIILHADGRAVVGDFLIINDVAAFFGRQIPFGLLGSAAVLVGIDEEQLLAGVGGEVLVTHLEGVVAAHRVDGEGIGAVAGLGLVAHDLGRDRPHGVVGLGKQADGGRRRGVVGQVLLALFEHAIPFAVVNGLDRIRGIDQVELQGKFALGEFAVGGIREVAGEDLRLVADIGLDVGRTSVAGDRGAVHVEAVLRLGRGQRPGVVGIGRHVQAQLGIGAAEPDRDAAALVAVGVEAVGAVVILLRGPDKVRGKVLHLVVFHGAGIGLQIPVAVGLGADGGHMAGAVDRDGLAVQLVQVGDQVALVLGLGRNFLGLDQIELHAVGGLGQLLLGSGVAAENRRVGNAVHLLAVYLNVSAAIRGGQRIAGNIIGIGFLIAAGNFPIGIGGIVIACVGGQLNIGAVQPGGDGFFALLEAIAAILIDAHLPNEICSRIDRLGILDRHFACPQIPVIVADRAHGLGAVRVVNDDRRAVRQLSQVGDEALVRRRLLLFHGVGKARDRAFDFAQDGLDLHGHVLVDGKGIALGPGLAVIGADEEHRALGRAGEGHHGALLDLARGHVRRRRFHRDRLVALDRDLAVEGVAQLQRLIVDADSQRHVDFVADLDAPDALRLFDHSLVDLDRVLFGVLQRDVRIGISAVIVIDLGHFEVAQLHIGADVRCRQRTDRRLLCFERHARGFLISGFAQFGQAFVSGTRTAADQRIAQADVGRSRIKIQIDAAGLILDVNVPAVDQGDDALDRERGAGLSRQGLGDRDGLRLGDLHGVGEACDLTLDFTENGLDLYGHVLVDGEGAALGPGLAVIGADEDHRALGRAGEGHHSALFDLARGHVRRRRFHSHGQVGGLFLEEAEGVDVGILAHPVDGEIAAVVFEILRFSVILRIRALDELAREVGAGRILQHEERILVGFVNKLYVRAVGEQELAFLVDEAELPVFIHRHGQDRRALGDVQLAVGSKACINCDLLVLSVVEIKLFRTKDLAVLRIVDDDLVSLSQRIGRDEGNSNRCRLLGLHGVCEHRDLAFRFAQDGLNLDAHSLGDGEGIALGPDPVVIEAVGDHRAFGPAGEGHHGARCDLAARHVGRRLRHGHDRLLGLDGGLRLHGSNDRNQPPEAKRLAGDVAGVVRVAAPVGVGHIDAHVARFVLGIHRGQIAVRDGERRPVRVGRRANANAVIVGGDIEHPAGGISKPTACVGEAFVGDGGDRPAVIRFGNRELAIGLCHDCGRGRAGGVRRRQRPGRAVLGHRDRHGVVGGDIRQGDRLPGRIAVRREGGRRHQRKQHAEQQHHGQELAHFLYHHRSTSS